MVRPKPMIGLTIPYRGVQVHVAHARNADLVCHSGRGHKRIEAPEIPRVIAALRAAGPDLARTGELRLLLMPYGDPLRLMSDAEVLEKAVHLLESGRLHALECGGASAPTDPPGIAFGKLQLHVGTKRTDLSRCSGEHSHEVLQGKTAPERLETLIASSSTNAAALAEAAVQATGDRRLRNLPARALAGRLAALAASGSLVLCLCGDEKKGGGGAVPQSQSQGQSSAAAAAGAGAGTAAGAGAAGSSTSAAPKPSTSPRPTAAEKPLTWVRVELVDEDGNFLDGEDYEMTLSDGSVRKGKTGKSPLFADQIPEGVCSVKFPKLHKNNWKPPGSK